MPTRDNDLNWLAGIWEGEGTAGLRFNKGRHENSPRRRYLYVGISQTNEEMLLEVQRIVGYGKIYGVDPRNPNHKRQWMWYVACNQARTFLIMLLPFVRSPHKRTQIETALALDVEARADGTIVRRRTLAMNSKKRWEKYRAEISRIQA